MSDADLDRAFNDWMTKNVEVMSNGPLVPLSKRWALFRGGYDAAVARASAAETERDELRARVAEFEAVRDGEVLVEGSWIPRAELSTVLGNVMRTSDEYRREVKAMYMRASAAEAALARVRSLTETIADELRDLAELHLYDDETGKALNVGYHKVMDLADRSDVAYARLLAAAGSVPVPDEQATTPRFQTGSEGGCYS